LAFLAWQWVPLHGPVVTGLLGWPEPPDRIRRLNLLLDSYGLEDRTGFIDEVITRIGYNRDVMVRKAAEGNQGYRSLIEQGHLVGMDEALSFLAGNGEELQHHLR
jgi:hypothetical protein